MIKKVVKKTTLDRYNPILDDLAYWLGKNPEERIAAVQYLRKQHNGTTARLQRTVRVIQQT